MIAIEIVDLLCDCKSVCECAECILCWWFVVAMAKMVCVLISNVFSSLFLVVVVRRNRGLNLRILLGHPMFVFIIQFEVKSNPSSSYQDSGRKKKRDIRYREFVKCEGVHFYCSIDCMISNWYFSRDLLVSL